MSFSSRKSAIYRRQIKSASWCFDSRQETSLSVASIHCWFTGLHWYSVILFQNWDPSCILTVHKIRHIIPQSGRFVLFLAEDLQKWQWESSSQHIFRIPDRKGLTCDTQAVQWLQTELRRGHSRMSFCKFDPQLFLLQHHQPDRFHRRFCCRLVIYNTHAKLICCGLLSFLNPCLFSAVLGMAVVPPPSGTSSTASPSPFSCSPGSYATLCPPSTPSASSGSSTWPTRGSPSLCSTTSSTPGWSWVAE